MQLTLFTLKKFQGFAVCKYIVISEINCIYLSKNLFSWSGLVKRSCNEADFRLVKLEWQKSIIMTKPQPVIVVLSAAVSSTENSVKENAFDVEGNTTLSKGKNGNMPCCRRKENITWAWTEGARGGEALSDKNWISGNITLPRADENKDKPLLSAEDECHGTNSSFEKRDL